MHKATEGLERWGQMLTAKPHMLPIPTSLSLVKQAWSPGQDSPQVTCLWLLVEAVASTSSAVKYFGITPDCKNCVSIYVA